MIVSQVEYVLGALRAMRERDAAIAEVREETVAAYNSDVDRRLEGTVWNAGCASWYADHTGRISALWPDWTFAFRDQLRTFDADGYDLLPAPVHEPAAT